MVARGKTEWETTFDAMSDGIFIFDRGGELKRVNRAGAAIRRFILVCCWAVSVVRSCGQ